ncbi:MAG: UvrD-helicase domain-containing protein [Bacteroidota bacterium]
MQNQSSFQVYNASAGSGKTYTLVKEYLKILLQTDNALQFQSILAITFTNKAAGEMKERVLNTLRDIATEKDNDIFYDILKETGLPTSVLQKRAKNSLYAILKNYSAFSINTIDTFTHKLIRTFAFDLGISMNFDVEMDTDYWINEAVENVMSKIGVDKNITKILVDYALQQADDDKAWDMTRDLRGISKLLLYENDAEHLEGLQNKTIPDFLKFRDHLNASQEAIIKRFEEIGERGLKIIDDSGVERDDFYRAMFPNHFKNLATDLSKAKFFDQNKLKERVENNDLLKKKISVDISVIDEILPELLKLYKESEELFSTYTLNNLLKKGLTPLAVLNQLNRSLNGLKEENNKKFIAEFNKIISKHLKEQPAAYIYERIGEKYQYYFIDEMQDTSVMQWQNLIPLVENALSQENAGLLLVGDGKQSIYRWRGGNPEQFICLSKEENKEMEVCSPRDTNPFHIQKQVKNLDTNYRSFSNIIDFNNQFFTHVSNLFIKDSHTELYKTGNKQKFNKKTGGYVNIEYVEEKLTDENRYEVIPEKIEKIIRNLEGKIDLSEICILVRKTKESIAVANYLTQAGIQVISSDSLLLKNDKKVDFIINLFYFLIENEDKNAKFNLLYFLHEHLSIKENVHEFIAEFINLEVKDLFKKLEVYNIFYNVASFAYTSLYESVEQIIRSFDLAEAVDAYLQYFLDEVLQFSQQKSQSTREFLEYWELKKEELSISASENKEAVNILTVHKSKGLEFRVVIFPFDINIFSTIDPKAWYHLGNYKNNHGFDEFYVSSSANIKNCGVQGESIYKIQNEHLELDNFNILYVALTRAVEQLYIISENVVKARDIKYFSQYLKDFLQKTGKWEEDKFVYEYGENKFIQTVEKGLERQSIYQEKFISTPWQEHEISIVTNSALMWDTERGDAIEYGNVIHKIMENVFIESDVDKSVDQFITDGILKPEEGKNIGFLLQELVNHPELRDYYRQGLRVYNEREIINEDSHVLIPDRLVFDGSKVTIIDYKTGKQEKKHKLQIDSYANVLQEMDYEINKKILVYINQEISIIES